MDDNSNSNKENTDIENINGDTGFEDDYDEYTDNKIPETTKTQEIADAEYFAPVEEQRRVAEAVFDWIEIFSSAFLTVILLFTFIFRLVTVQGPSMQETLYEKDNLIISHLFYTPKQGDIIVIQVPNKQYETPIIKRVIATEGQTIRFDFENWIVYVDGEPLDEPYVNYEYITELNGNQTLKPMRSEDLYKMYESFPAEPITVEKGKIFVMGDNRNHSSDSRVSNIGQVDVRDVVGRVLLRVFPFDKFGIVKPNES